MKTIKAYSIRVWDGADRCNHKFFVTSESEAKKWVEKNAYDTYREETFTFFDTINEWKYFSKEELKAEALAKLSILEREALGF